jgi:hypothetical protein
VLLVHHSRPVYDMEQDGPTGDCEDARHFDYSSRNLIPGRELLHTKCGLRIWANGHALTIELPNTLVKILKSTKRYWKLQWLKKGPGIALKRTIDEVLHVI